MSLSDNYTPDKSLGNGSTTVFTGTWSPLNEDYMRVYLEDVSSGVQTLQTLGTHYTLSFTASGYSITMVTAPSSSYYVLRAREITIDQSAPYKTSRGWQGATVEDSFDKLTAISQELNERVGRAIKVPLGSTETIELPLPETDKVIGWNASGELENKLPNTAAYLSVSAFMQTVLDDANAAAARTTLGAASVDNLYPFMNDFRLSLTTNNAVDTSDVTAASTVYMTPHVGNKIGLYDGTNWNIRSTSQLNIGIGALTANKGYDVFCRDAAGVPTLEIIAWTDATTRSQALFKKDGVWVLQNDFSYRYLGSFYTSALGQTNNSKTKRHLWNYYNRVLSEMFVTDATATWAYTTATHRQVNANTANKVEFFIGIAEDIVQLEASARVSNTSANVGVQTSIGINSTSAPHTNCISNETYCQVANQNISTGARLNIVPSIGLSYAAWLEYSAATGTSTWTATGLSGTKIGGLTGKILI